ncbi:uncharacterized protein TNCV_736951 [Trichonephila clavipes]|nr:uncharacterized protein TNCV_736951 [Trichonephila clavipes]
MVITKFYLALKEGVNHGRHPESRGVQFKAWIEIVAQSLKCECQGGEGAKGKIRKGVTNNQNSNQQSVSQPWAESPALVILALTLVRARRVMENLETVDNTISKDLGPNSTENSSPNKLKEKGPEYEKGLLQARLNYIRSLLQIEIDRPGPTPDVRTALESELEELESKMKLIEGKMTELLPRPIALCPKFNKSKAVKRSAAPVNKPAKTNKAISTTDTDYTFPRKTAKNPPLAEKIDINTNNSFEVLDSVMTDVEEVTPAFKSKPIFMKIFDSYNLVLQDLYRNFPTATNTHAKGYIKIEAQNEKDHDEITKYLKDKNLEFYTIEPPITRPLKLVIKGLPVDIDPEDIKKDLISKGIKIVKTTQLKRFVSKTPLPIYMIEIERDENVNDIFQVSSKHQMSAPGFASSASDINENSKNNALNKETHNVSQNVSGEFGLFQAINEMQTIFTLFPSLLSEMEKSSKCTDPTEKLQCLLRVICPTPNTV